MRDKLNRFNAIARSGMIVHGNEIVCRGGSGKSVDRRSAPRESGGKTPRPSFLHRLVYDAGIYSEDWSPAIFERSLAEGAKMMRLTRQLFQVCSVMGLLLCPSVATSADEQMPVPALHGISVMTWGTFVEGNADKGPCKVDNSALVTALTFVANQSVRLKFARVQDKSREAEALHEKAKALPVGTPAQVEAMNAAERAAFTPSIWFHIYVVEMPSGCVATVTADASAPIRRGEIIHSGKTVYFPRVKLWRETVYLKGPHSTFGVFTIQSTEELLKTFVNVWMISQE